MLCWDNIGSTVFCQVCTLSWEPSSFQWNGMIGSILLELTRKMCHKCQGARTVVQLAGDRKCVSYKKSQDCRAAWKFLSQLVPGLPYSYIHLPWNTCKPSVPILKNVLEIYHKCHLKVSRILKKCMYAELIVFLEDPHSAEDIMAAWHSCTPSGHTAHSLLWGSVSWYGWDNVVPSSEFAYASPPYFLCGWGSSWNIKLSPKLSQHSQWHLEVENASQIFMRQVSIFQITVFP